MKKFIVAIFLILAILVPEEKIPITFAAEEDGIIYQIYDENGHALTERQGVEIGDKYIDSNLNEYTIISVDENNGFAKAKYIQTYSKPNLTVKNVENIAASPKKIALYMTHNDESYLIGDGTSSVYGAGGIHDVAAALKDNLENYGIDVELDETLHIPHDSKAYSRSNVTANRLLKAKPDAIFDIHRDGASRNTYLTTVDGKEHSQVRIVLGQANPSSQGNLQFALSLISVADEKCPWLFKDIYWGKGHYNQALSDKALLFEMGAHTIEKSYVLETTKNLAKIINDTIYKTNIEEKMDFVVDEADGKDKPIQNNKTFKVIVILVPSVVVLITIISSLIVFQKRKNKK